MNSIARQSRVYTRVTEEDSQFHYTETAMGREKSGWVTSVPPFMESPRTLSKLVTTCVSMFTTRWLGR